MLRDTLGLLRLTRDAAVYRLRTLLEEARMQPQRGPITRIVLHLPQAVRTIRRCLRSKFFPARLR